MPKSDAPCSFNRECIETFDAICEQIHQRFGAKSEKQFEKKTVKTLELISKNPFLFSSTSVDINIRKAVIDKLSSFFYEVKEDKIEILFFWDNRQEPTGF